MLKTVSTILRPPIFTEDEDKTRRARYTNFIAWAFFAVAVLYEVFLRIFANYVRLTILDVALFVVAAIAVTVLVLLRKGRVQLASIVLVALTWAAINGLAATGFGIKDSSYIINFAIILMAGLLLGWQASLVMTFTSVVSGFALAYAEQNGFITVSSYAVTSFARDIMFVFGLNGVLIPKDQNERQILLTASKWVPETDRLCYAIEQQAGKQTSRPVLLKVRKPGQKMTASR